MYRAIRMFLVCLLMAHVAFCVMIRGRGKTEEPHKLTVKELQSVIEDPVAARDKKADAQLLLAQAYWEQKNYQMCIQECARLIAAYPEETYARQRRQALCLMGNAYQAEKEYDKALELYHSFLDAYAKKIKWNEPTRDPCTVNVESGMIDIYLIRKEYRKALDMLTSVDVLCGNPGYDIQRKIYLCAKETKKSGEEVLLEAKILYNVAPMDKIQEATDAVCAELKAIDGDTKRADRFIELQETGTGDNPISRITVSDENRAMYEFLSRRCWGDDSAIGDFVRREKVMELYLMGDEPDRALRKAVQELYENDAPINQLNRAVLDIAKCLKACDGNPLRADRFIQAHKEGKAFPLP